MNGFRMWAMILLTAVSVPSSLQDEGTKIGSLYQCAHDLRGEVFVKNDREILIRGLNYDGKGPAAWFHGQKLNSTGVYTSDKDNFMTLPYPGDSCDRLKPGKAYKDEDVTLILPVSIKQFETIGVFCYQYCHNFGHIRIPKDLNVPAAPSSLQIVQECQKPSYKGCSLSDTRNGKLEPDCKASAGNMLPNIMMTIFGIFFIRLIASQSN
ncbi:unnamed protein product [Orchesella dallaii]|uniref:DM13 domain-containing protein n=1 Tax=Orchesella dallaii TaxID=48710 RepID=A0ABP1QHK2_9HEXA